LRSRGFTLIEVLVALAIVTIGMAAVMEALTSSANTAIYLQDKTFAEWAALDRLETVRLTGAPPATGTSNDTVEYAGRNWEWRQKVTPTRVQHMVQIEVDVRPADSKAGEDRGWYASVTGFMSSDIDPGTTPEQSVFQWSPNAIDVVPPAPAPNTPSPNTLTP
jgi:general secretion pathway protein I